jgi:microcystin-dependent protein
MRYYSSVAKATVLTTLLNSVETQIALDSTEGFPTSFPFTLVISPDTATEEIVTVTGTSSTATYVVVRGEDGSSAQEHANGAVVRHMATGRDFADAQNHISAASGVHSLTGAVVGTSDTQTLSNKTLSSPIITGTVEISGLSVTGSATLPGNTSIGSTTSTQIGYLANVTSDIQTQINSLSSGAASGGVTGTMMAFLGTDTQVPAGWLLCNGQTVSRTTYVDLFTLIGTRYGTGNGTTTFHLPNFQSQFIRGAATASSPSGTPGGSNTHTHVSSYTDSQGGHTHTTSATGTVSGGDHSHTITGITGNTSTAGSHTHSYSGTVSATASSQRDVASGSLGAATYAHQHAYSGTTAAGGDHSHSFSNVSGATNDGGNHSHTIATTGTAATAGIHTHNVTVTSGSNIPTYIEVNWIVKA